MNMRIGLVLIGIVAVSCGVKTQNEALKQTPVPIVGTWQLISGTTIEKGDTTVIDYTKNLSFIKIINDTHFAFLKHDLAKGKDSSAAFSAGGGSYSLEDSLYTERLDYCNEREWEGNDFKFTITLKNDTLIQRGIEKVESAGINRLNIEKYIRLKN
ncbi:MAG: lipocalin-like domain-containing protein [Cytophagaceae bacterium]|nr:lipocalin-like domain-containing protein [Cytophagaceae bacterium]